MTYELIASDLERKRCGIIHIGVSILVRRLGLATGKAVYVRSRRVWITVEHVEVPPMRFTLAEGDTKLECAHATLIEDIVELTQLFWNNGEVDDHTIDIPADRCADCGKITKLYRDDREY